MDNGGDMGQSSGYGRNMTEVESDVRVEREEGVHVVVEEEEEDTVLCSNEREIMISSDFRSAKVVKAVTDVGSGRGGQLEPVIARCDAMSLVDQQHGIVVRGDVHPVAEPQEPGAMEEELMHTDEDAPMTPTGPTGGETGTAVVPPTIREVDDFILRTLTILNSSSPTGPVPQSRKRAIEHALVQVPQKSCRRESLSRPIKVDPGLMMQGALVETPPQHSEESESWNVQLAHLRANQQFWAPYGRASATWAFYVVNDNTAPDSAHPQQMRCAICHPAQQDHRADSASRMRKGIVTYNKHHGTTSMKKHVSQEHDEIFGRYKATRKPGVVTRGVGRQLCKNRKGPPPSIPDSFSIKKPYKMSDPAQQRFLEDLVLYIAKGYHPLSSVENVWLQRLVTRQCGGVVFPSRRQLVDEVIPHMVSKTMEMYILPSVAGCSTATLTFDFWMSWRGFDTYALVINFINESWTPCHVTLGLFEVRDTDEAALAEDLKELLSSFNLTDKVIAFVRDERGSSGSLSTALTSVVSCAPLQLSEPYAATCFGHVMSKACTYATDDQKVCTGMSKVSIQKVQATLQKTINWIQKTEHVRQNWMKTCIDAGLRPRLLKTPVKTRFASKVLFFQEILEYQDVIKLCHSSESTAIQSQVLSPENWAVAKAVTDSLTPIVQECITNEGRGYWLLSDALATAFRLCIRMHNNVCERGLVNPNFQAGNFDLELEGLQTRMMAEVLGVLAPFLSFTDSFSAKHAHNLLALMLDPRYKGLSLVKDFVGREKAMQVVAEVDATILVPYLVTVFKRLNPSRDEDTPTLSPSAKDTFAEDSLFGCSASNEETIVGHLKSELSLFRRLLINPDDCRNPLVWWKDHEVQFPNVGFLARQILGIAGSQVEIDRIFTLAGVITSLQRLQLGMDNLDKLVLILKNWPEYPEAGCEIVESGVKEFLTADDNMIEEYEELIADAGMFDDY